MGIRGRRRKQPLDDLKETRRHWKLKEEVLDRTVWRTGCGRGCGPVVRMNDLWISYIANTWYIWDLWCVKFHLDRVFSEYFNFFCRFLPQVPPSYFFHVMNANLSVASVAHWLLILLLQWILMQEFLCPISRHCDKVQDGQPMKRSSILDRSKGFYSVTKRQDRLCAAPGLLFSAYQGLFLRV
jgi:hypothetical protein